MLAHGVSQLAGCQTPRVTNESTLCLDFVLSSMLRVSDHLIEVLKQRSCGHSSDQCMDSCMRCGHGQGRPCRVGPQKFPGSSMPLATPAAGTSSYTTIDRRCRVRACQHATQTSAVQLYTSKTHRPGTALMQLAMQHQCAFPRMDSSSHLHSLSGSNDYARG